MQIKTTMKYHFTSVRMCVCVCVCVVWCVGKEVEKLKPSHNVDGNVNWWSFYGKQYEKSSEN